METFHHLAAAFWSTCVNRLSVRLTLCTVYIRWWHTKPTTTTEKKTKEAEKKATTATHRAYAEQISYQNMKRKEKKNKTRARLNRFRIICSLRSAHSYVSECARHRKKYFIFIWWIEFQGFRSFFIFFISLLFLFSFSAAVARIKIYIF